MASRIIHVLVLLTGVLAVGCSSVKKPVPSLRSAEIGKTTSDGFTVNFNLDVKNPNAFTLPLADTDYTLSFGGAKVVTDKLKANDSIPAGESKAFTIPVNLTFESLLKAEEIIRKAGGDVPYEFNGALGYASGKSDALASLGVPTKVPLNYKGTLPLRKVFSDPTVLMNSPAARKLAGKGLDSLLGR